MNHLQAVAVESAGIDINFVIGAIEQTDRMIETLVVTTFVKHGSKNERVRSQPVLNDRREYLERAIVRENRLKPLVAIAMVDQILQPAIVEHVGLEQLRRHNLEGGEWQNILKA